MAKMNIQQGVSLIIILICLVIVQLESIEAFNAVHKLSVTVAPNTNASTIAVKSNSSTLSPVTAPTNVVGPIEAPLADAKGLNLTSDLGPNKTAHANAGVFPNKPPPIAPTLAPPPASATVGPATNVRLASGPVADVKPAKTVANLSGPTNKTVVPNKLTQYFEPVCESVDKLTPEQFFKIQSHLKNFVERTAGKMSACFLQHYAVDPNLAPITRAQLSAICLSRTDTIKSQFKAFQNCASDNWDSLLDKELDRIIATRENCSKNHNHPKNETAPALSHDGPDELSIIGDVVSKVLDNGSNSSFNKSDIKLIDVSGPNAAKPPPPPVLAGGHKPTTNPQPQQSNKTLMNDPNTVLVFVDDSKTTKAPITFTTNKPLMLEVNKTITNKNLTVAATTLKPLVLFDKTTTVKPLPGLLKVLTTAPPSSNTTKTGPKQTKTNATLAVKINPPSTTKLPVAKPTQHTASTHSPSTKKPTNTTTLSLTTPKTIASVVVKKVGSTSKAPATTAGQSKTTPKSAAVGAVSSKKPSAGPLDSLESMLVKQDKEKQNLENKMKAERDNMMKQLTEKQDQIEAQKAIKALQAHRASTVAGGHGTYSDARLHQLEHERQMAIDPIGHTIKHQQYELSKQQRQMAGR